MSLERNGTFQPLFALFCVVNGCFLKSLFLPEGSKDESRNLSCKLGGAGTYGNRNLAKPFSHPGWLRCCKVELKLYMQVRITCRQGGSVEKFKGGKEPEIKRNKAGRRMLQRTQTQETKEAELKTRTLGSSMPKYWDQLKCLNC